MSVWTLLCVHWDMFMGLASNFGNIFGNICCLSWVCCEAENKNWIYMVVYTLLEAYATIYQRFLATWKAHQNLLNCGSTCGRFAHTCGQSWDTIGLQWFAWNIFVCARIWLKEMFMWDLLSWDNVFLETFFIKTNLSQGIRLWNVFTWVMELIKIILSLSLFLSLYIYTQFFIDTCCDSMSTSVGSWDCSFRLFAYLCP